MCSFADQDRIEALEFKVRTQDEDIIKLTAEIHKLRTENEEKNKKLLEALEILQGRNPEIADFIKTAQAYILLSSPTIERMGKYLDKQSF